MSSIENMRGLTLENASSGRKKALVPLYIVLFYCVVGVTHEIVVFGDMMYAYGASKQCMEDSSGLITTPYSCMWLSGLLLNIGFISIQITIFKDFQA